MNLHSISKGECVLSIDVGTGGTKACFVSASGKVLVSGFSAHSAPVQSPVGGPLSLEQDQESWWQATVQAVQSCISAFHLDLSYVRGVAVTGQMQDVVMVPKAGSPLKSKAILYSDTRAGSELDEIVRLVGSSSKIDSTTGNAQGASSVLAKLRWIDKHLEGAAGECEHLFFGGHDYVVWRLCGSYVTDTTTASTTGLTNTSFQYAQDLIEKAGLIHWVDKFPTIFPVDSPCGEITSTASNELGCPELQGLPVLHCSGDAGTCTLGAGAANPGYSYAYIGTSGWVAGSFPSPTTFLKPMPGVYTLGHPDSSLVFKTGSVMTAAGNLAWASKLTCMSFEQINELAASAAPGSGRLLYLPFINGERCPIDRPDYRAAYIGISSTTTQADMFRAVMEGVAFAMRSAQEAMLVDHNAEAPLRLVGGGARSALWPLIMAEVFQQTVEVLADAQDVGVRGAAILAGKWLGWHSSLCPEGHWFNVESIFKPCPANFEAYNDLYLAYVEACKALGPVFNRKRVEHVKMSTRLFRTAMESHLLLLQVNESSPILVAVMEVPRSGSGSSVGTISWLKSSDNFSVAVLSDIHDSSTNISTCQIQIQSTIQTFRGWLPGSESQSSFEFPYVRWSSPCVRLPSTSNSTCAIGLTNKGVELIVNRKLAWNTDTSGRNVSSAELMDGNGELVLLDSANRTVWSSANVASTVPCFDLSRPSRPPSSASQRATQALTSIMLHVCMPLISLKLTG